MRLDCELSVFRRAEINLLIASILKCSRSTKYAREALDLFDIVRRSHRGSTADDLQHIQELEDFASNLLEKYSQPVVKTAEPGTSAEQTAGDSASSVSEMSGAHVDAMQADAETTTTLSSGNVLYDSGWVTADETELAKPGEKLFTIEGYLSW